MNKTIDKLDTVLDFTDCRPIGIFDSGVGGLSIVKCISQHLPNEHLIYLADNLHAPYGDKATTFITDRVNIIAKQLIDRQVKALVIACNTATVNAIDQLRKQVDIPIIGVEPAIKPAAIYSKTKRVGILVTQATARNTRFLDLVKKHAVGVEVIIQPCPGLVELIEQGEINSDRCGSLLHDYLSPLLTKKVDTIVLGCTHYPFLINKIENIIGHSMKIMDTAAPVTKELHRQLIKNKLCCAEKQQGKIEFFSSNPSKSIEKVCQNLISQPVILKSF